MGGSVMTKVKCFNCEVEGGKRGDDMEHVDVCSDGDGRIIVETWVCTPCYDEWDREGVRLELTGLMWD